MDHVTFQRATGMDIFESRDDLGGFKFVIPHTALSARDVRIERRDHRWHLTYTDMGQEFAGSAEDMTGAYLALIADRCGLVAVVTAKEPEPDADSA